MGKRGQCRDKESLWDCAHQIGVGIINICGGQGKCHTCKVQVLSGSVSDPTPSELEIFSGQEVEAGWRLACQTYPTSDCILNLPPESITTPQRTQIEGLGAPLLPEPIVLAYPLELKPPSLSDLRADADRVFEGLKEQYQIQCKKMDIDVIRDLPIRLRSLNWRFRVSLRGDEVIALHPLSSPHLGLAIDLGTTKVAGYLLDLDSGKTLAAKAEMNPQISFGEDIVTRITRILKSPDEGLRLQKVIVNSLNQLAEDLCSEVGSKTEEIVDSVVVGNTAMHHILLCLPVEQLVYSPFIPAVKEALNIKARDVGLRIAPGAYVHFLPNIAGFIGADHTAVLLSIKASEAKGIVFVLDIGTNTEVSLIDEGEIYSVSCASGPAFEGGHIRDGMRASSGTIERVRIEQGKIQYQTIDNMLPIGICGSGILDTIAQMYLTGVLDENGRIHNDHPRVRSHQNEIEFVLVSEEESSKRPSIGITQADVRAFQLAKAAIRTGIQVLLETKGLTEEDIDQIVIAGAFGSYIHIESAIAIGMLPSLPLERFLQVGNAAGMGAKLALVSYTKRAEAQNIASRVHYIELATAVNFMNTFVQANYFGNYRIKRGKREEIV